MKGRQSGAEAEPVVKRRKRTGSFLPVGLTVPRRGVGAGRVPQAFTLLLQV